LSKVISIMSLGAVAHCGTIYYQPNGLFVPISVGLSAPAQQVQAPLQEVPQARSAWSLSNLFGLGSLFGGGKSSTELKPAVPDAATATLTQFLIPMRIVAAKFLAGIQARLDKASTKDVASIIRGPLNQFKDYLASNWPSPDTKTLMPPVPPIRGSSAADLARLAHN
ncbi:hypothetical protein GGI20_003338, partial [Coemansia sp. BCRC 34301]